MHAHMEIWIRVDKTLNVNNVRRDVIMNKSIYLSEISSFVVSDGVMIRS